MLNTLDLTSQNHRLADETVRRHDRDKGVFDTFRCHVRLTDQWDGKVVRFNDFLWNIAVEKFCTIRSHDGRMLRYRRVERDDRRSLEVDYDWPTAMEKGTQFFIEFEYWREHDKRLLGKEPFVIGVNSPFGTEPAKLAIQMPYFYYIRAAAKVEDRSASMPTLLERLKKFFERSNGDSTASIGQTVGVKYGRLTGSTIAERERIIRNPLSGVLHREYIFFVGDGRNPPYQVTLKYKLGLARRYLVMVGVAIGLPIAVMALASLIIINPSMDITPVHRLLATVSSLAFGPPLVLSMRQFFLHDVLIHARKSWIDTLLLLVMIAAPILPVVLLVQRLP